MPHPWNQPIEFRAQSQLVALDITEVFHQVGHQVLFNKLPAELLQNFVLGCDQYPFNASDP